MKKKFKDFIVLAIAAAVVFGIVYLIFAPENQTEYVTCGSKDDEEDFVVDDDSL